MQGKRERKSWKKEVALDIPAVARPRTGASNQPPGRRAACRPKRRVASEKKKEGTQEVPGKGLSLSGRSGGTCGAQFS